MFENLKTGNMIKKLIKLVEYDEKLNNYNKSIEDFVPSNILTKVNSYGYLYGVCREEYVIKLNNIKYCFTNSHSINIEVNDILIAKGYIEYVYEYIKTEWNHKLPKEMLLQIKKDSKIIDEYIKDIKDYMKNNKTTEELRYNKEQKELERIFRKDRKEC